jgi:hypothetical protein
MKTLGKLLVGGGILFGGLLNPLFSQSKEDKAPDYVSGKILNKHYAFDKSDLTKEDSVYVAKYFDFLMNSEARDFEGLCFEGYASAPGSEEYNDSLSFVRAKKLADYFKNLYPGVKTEIFYFGEVPRKGEINDSLNKLDQVVKVIPKSNELYQSLKVLEANPNIENKKIKQYVLLDKSGSMGSNGAWKYLQNHDFSGSDSIFAFSRNPGQEDLVYVDDIKKLFPRGATCYYLANENLLSEKKISNGNLLTIINGCDNVGESSPEKIVDEAIKNNLSLSFLYLTENPNDEFGRKLREMAHKTKGGFTCVKTH